MPVSVERVDKDKDTDADQTRTVRPVESEQSIGLFTQREEIDIDFSVSGLSHAIVKEAERFRVQELVRRIESHLIEQHFMPTCSRKTSTIHSAKIRRR